MAKEQPQPADAAPPDLPPGVKLVRTLRGHTDTVGHIAWSPDGKLLASPSIDGTVRIWDTDSGNCLHKIDAHRNGAYCATFNTATGGLATSGTESTIKLWDYPKWRLDRALDAHEGLISCLSFSPDCTWLASAGIQGPIKLWDPVMGRLKHTLADQSSDIVALAFDKSGEFLACANRRGSVNVWDLETGRFQRAMSGSAQRFVSITFDPDNDFIAGGCYDGTILQWDAGGILRILEGHTTPVFGLVVSSRGLLASRDDHTIRMWKSSTGENLGVISAPSSHRYWLQGLAFHPHRPLLAAVGHDRGAPKEERDCAIHIFELDLKSLLDKPAPLAPHYLSAKIVLVGDSGVGKTGLGWRMAHGAFKEHASTHGQQFWPLKQLDKTRADGATCEAILWDLAGQPDYRLIHALFLDDADLALVLFDPTHADDPLHGVEFWLKQLKVGPDRSPHAPREEGGVTRSVTSTVGPPTILVAARSDRGSARLTQEELDAYCKQRGIKGYLCTSAKAGDGIDTLIDRMKALIPWDEKPATVTTVTFKRIKDFVLSLKEAGRCAQVILTPAELRQRLEATDAEWKFSDAEMLTAVGHLATHGYVTKLKTSRGEPRILLAPELLNNLAASFILEARRQERGLGSIEEQMLLAGNYVFPEIGDLTQAERDVMLDSAVVLFLEHNVCFRETDPLNNRAYLVFPELINLKKPILDDERPIEDGVAYTVSGAIENVYASLVVLLGYTHTFIRASQWHNQARYTVANDLLTSALKIKVLRG